jgi:hypothetical protein
MSGRNLENIEDVDLFTTVAGGSARGVIDDFCNDCASEWSDCAGGGESVSDHSLDSAV